MSAANRVSFVPYMIISTYSSLESVIQIDSKCKYVILIFMMEIRMYGDIPRDMLL